MNPQQTENAVNPLYEVCNVLPLPLTFPVAGIMAAPRGPQRAAAGPSKPLGAEISLALDRGFFRGVAFRCASNDSRFAHSEFCPNRAKPAQHEWRVSANMFMKGKFGASLAKVV